RGACAIVGPMGRRLLWLPLCLWALGCGRDITAKELGEPCTRTSQCETGLVCLAGACRPQLDAGADAAVDAGS
ncbi:MAG: hypothetical protein PVH76_07295, partial [Myxococcales bacterium]